MATARSRLVAPTDSAYGYIFSREPMNIDRIIVRSRLDALLFDPEHGFLIISVTDPLPTVEPVHFTARIGLRDLDQDILRLSFDDIDVTDNRKLEYTDPDSGEARCWAPMLAEHARTIRPFLRSRLRADVSAVLVHCHAGISRSPSIAFAICDAFGLPRTIIDWEDRNTARDAPNRHVYDVTLAALQATAEDSAA